jgi:hypothetical protein
MPMLCLPPSLQFHSGVLEHISVSGEYLFFISWELILTNQIAHDDVVAYLVECVRESCAKDEKST